MLKKIYRMAVAGLICLQLFGCNNNSMEFQGEEHSLELEDIGREEGTGGDVQNRKEVPLDEEGNDSQKKESLPKEQLLMSVHVCGAVKNPGVYQAKEGSRIYSLIEMAGGFLPEADENYLNLAKEAVDGMQIRVPTVEEVLAYGVVLSEEGTAVDGQESKVDINQADEALLCTLPGIGASRARSIIKYREENGGFQTPEDIMKISGIKEAAYEKIKDYIIVSK